MKEKKLLRSSVFTFELKTQPKTFCVGRPKQSKVWRAWRLQDAECWRNWGGASCGAGCQGLSQFQTLPWRGGGVMSTRRKHRALNGITQGDVNLGRAGGELNMSRGLQWEGWKRVWKVRGEGRAGWETISERKKKTAESQRTETPLHSRVVHYHFCSP